MTDNPRYDKSVVKGEPVYPSIPPGTLVWFWPGARPEGRKVLAKTMSSRDKFTGTITYRVEFYDDDGGLHSDFAAWTHVEPVYQGDRVGASVTHDNGDKPLSDGISTTCPHCGERIEGSDLELNTDPPDGVVRWFPSLLSREEWAKQKGGGAKP